MKNNNRKIWKAYQVECAEWVTASLNLLVIHFGLTSCVVCCLDICFKERKLSHLK